MELGPNFHAAAPLHEWRELHAALSRVGRVEYWPSHGFALREGALCASARVEPPPAPEAAPAVAVEAPAAPEAAPLAAVLDAEDAEADARADEEEEEEEEWAGAGAATVIDLSGASGAPACALCGGEEQYADVVDGCMCLLCARCAAPAQALMPGAPLPDTGACLLDDGVPRDEAQLLAALQLAHEWAARLREAHAHEEAFFAAPAGAGLWKPFVVLSSSLDCVEGWDWDDVAGELVGHLRAAFGVAEAVELVAGPIDEAPLMERVRALAEAEVGRMAGAYLSSGADAGTGAAAAAASGGAGAAAADAAAADGKGGGSAAAQEPEAVGEGKAGSDDDDEEYFFGSRQEGAPMASMTFGVAPLRVSEDAAIELAAWIGENVPFATFATTEAAAAGSQTTRAVWLLGLAPSGATVGVCGLVDDGASAGEFGVA